jgi:molecular chaperone HscB
MASKNYFQLLGLALNYTIDKKSLTDNYRKLQAQFHPDKFSTRSDMEKRLSVQRSSQINDAFQTLKNPLKRAIYLLSLLGQELKDNETTMDPIFLMEQMELREQLDAISQLEQSDQKQDPTDALEKMQSQVRKTINALIKEISHLFTENEQQNNLESIKKVIIKMQFLYKFEQQCEDLEEDLQNNY